MIAVVYLSRKLGKADFQKRHDFDSFAQHLLIKGMTDFPASYVVMQHTHFHPLARLVDQHVTYQSSHRVVFKNIKLYMNVVFRPVKLLYQIGQHRSSVYINGRPVTSERKRSVHMAEEIHQRLFFDRSMQRNLCLVFGHRTLGQTGIPFPADEMLPAGAPPEKKIKDKSRNRQKEQHKYPCHSLHRIAVVKYNHKHGGYDNRKIKDIECGHKDVAPDYDFHQNLNFRKNTSIL